MIKEKIDISRSGLTQEAWQFIHDWQWDIDELRKYQTQGLKIISPSIIKNLSKFKPKEGIMLYRFFTSLDGEKQSMKNKLMSFSSSLKDTMSVIEDGGASFMHIVYAEPSEILVDTSLMPNYERLDFVLEVIAINNGKLK